MHRHDKIPVRAGLTAVTPSPGGMPVPKRRRRRKQNEAMGLLVLGGLVLLLGLTALFLRALSENPISVGIPTALVVAGALYAGFMRQQHRKRERRRQWEIKNNRSREIARYHVMGPKEFE